MNKRIKTHALLVAGLALAASSVSSWAAEAPVGRWQTIDDETGKPKAVIEITREGQTLNGRIIKLINPSRPNPTCDKCDGERKGKPIEGMTILWGLTEQNGDWEGGKILDPEKGKVYSAKLIPQADGKSLKVRGYMGFSALGRTQQWLKAP